MSEFDSELQSQIKAWLAEDPDADTRAELERLLDGRYVLELRDRFSAMLSFGTAGLRGILGAGPNRMNHVVVAKATAGLCAWTVERVDNAQERGVCIGFDGRRKSREFARRAAEVAAGAGFRVYAFDDVVPTPLLAFSVLDRRAAAGIMVTASHNPPDYNGYKVYWEDGAQIVPPHDEGIAERIAHVGPVPSIPHLGFNEAREENRIKIMGGEVERRYLDGVRRLLVHPESPRTITIAYTALHGVGNRLATTALREAGFDRVHSVPEQAEPDGSFPTVDFPNPEEPGAMDLVLDLAKREHADLVIANDPDADRLAIAVPNRNGSYVQLTGNEIGCTLAHYLLSERTFERPLVISTVVSSPMLGEIARAHGAAWEQTLTGFKWIASRALAHANEAEFVFGYEEALGYSVSTLVRDKDGISAAVVFADFAAHCKSRGLGVLDVIKETWRRYGMFLSRQVSVTMPGQEGAARIDAIMETVRSSPPRDLAGRAILVTLDFENGTRATSDGNSTTIDYPSSNVLLFELEGGHRVMLRPSGTEPKIKYYFDVRIDLDADEPIAEGRTRGQVILDELEVALRKAAA